MATETDVIHVLSNKVSVLFCSVLFYDRRQEGVVNDGGKRRHTIVYKTQSEKVIICDCLVE